MCCQVHKEKNKEEMVLIHVHTLHVGVQLLGAGVLLQELRRA